MSNNSWYEKGELPPVGIECEAFKGSSWVKCEIKAHMKQAGQSCAFYQMDNCWGFDERHSKFRPIKTERELAIEAAVDATYPHGYLDSAKIIAGILFDAGLLRSKNES